MKILTLACQTLATALSLSFFISMNSFASGPALGPGDSYSYDPTVTKQSDDVSVRDVAASGANQILKQTRIGRRLEKVKNRLTRKYRFEYRKSFGSEPVPGADTPKTGSVLEASKTPAGPAKGLSFSGRLDNGLSPVFDFKSRLDNFAVSSQFRAFDHELDVDVSSPHLDRIVGGTAGIGLTSDGSRTDAVIRLKFEF